MKRYTVIRYGRIALQTVIIAAITVAIAAGLSCVFSRMQIIPAILACSTTWLIVWLVATLVFGRIYCSTVCPVGTLTDLSSWLTRTKKKHYSYCAPYSRTRISILTIAIVCSIAGVTAVVSILDPYSAFSRVVTAATRPVATGLAGLVIAAATLTVIIVTAHRRGRLICNTLCPVGTLLGGVSKMSLYHADINTDLCTNCGKCADRCPAQCINITDHTIDVSRCVVCFDCMAVCPNDAITYRHGRHQLSIPMMQRVAGSAGVSAIDNPAETPTAVRPVDRRTFILAVAGAAGAASQSFAAGSNPRYVADAVRLVPLNHVTPPGSPSRDHYLHRCTACGACIAACPTGVLTSSVKQFGIRHTLTPVMDFEKAYCSIDCVRCTEVCPTKALRPLTSKEKRDAPIGKARVCVTNCMLYENDTDCNVCAKACPKRAISICRTPEGQMMPQVEPELCIGCGRCANSCPSQPYSAIVIEGL